MCFDVQDLLFTERLDGSVLAFSLVCISGSFKFENQVVSEQTWIGL